MTSEAFKSFPLKACINTCMGVHTHSRIFPICRAQSHYSPWLRLSQSQNAAVASALSLLQLHSDSLLATTLCLKPTGCRSANRMQEIKCLTDSTCSSGLLQKGGLCSPIVYHLLLRISEMPDTQPEEGVDVSDLQPCRLLAWKWAVRGKGLENVQRCIRNSVMLLNTMKSISERPQTYLLKR